MRVKSQIRRLTCQQRKCKMKLIIIPNKFTMPEICVNHWNNMNNFTFISLSRLYVPKLYLTLCTAINQLTTPAYVELQFVKQLD